MHPLFCLVLAAAQSVLIFFIFCLVIVYLICFTCSMIKQSISQIKEIKSDLAEAAQEVYDEWDQDEDGYDEEFGYGGICQSIAEKMIEVMFGADISECFTVSCDHEVHVYCVVQCKEGVVRVDIPYSIYETGGAYTWKKINGVQFTEEDIVVDILNSDPEYIKHYIDDLELYYA